MQGATSPDSSDTACTVTASSVGGAACPNTDATVEQLQCVDEAVVAELLACARFGEEDELEQVVLQKSLV